MAMNSFSIANSTRGLDCLYNRRYPHSLRVLFELNSGALYDRANRLLT